MESPQEEERYCQGDTKGNYNPEHDRQFCKKLLTEENEHEHTGFCLDCWEKAFPTPEKDFKICPRCGRSSKDVKWYPLSRFCRDCIVNTRTKTRRKRFLALREKLGLKIPRTRKRKIPPKCVSCGSPRHYARHEIKTHRNYHEFRAAGI